jgi:hypothetical protein
MATAERVDKRWVERGIETYSTAAILGTLAHYGVAIDEAGFLELAKQHYPLALAEVWHEQWKGTGQFSRFPAAAAEELWARLKPGEAAPTDLALALIKLLQGLEGVLDGKPDDGTRETRFKVVEAYLPKVPTEAEQRVRFLGETLGALGEWSDVFDGMAEALAKKGHAPVAARLAAIDEALFPDHVGITRALIKLQSGDASGIDDLRTLGHDAKRIPLARLAAAEGLLDHQRGDDARAVLVELLDVAEKEKDAELAGMVVESLRRLLELEPTRADHPHLRQRIEQLVRAFDVSA